MNKHRLHRLKLQITQILALVASCSLLITTMGCDAFVRKFTRKPKKDKVKHEEMVLAPEEYKGSGLTKEELYRQSLLYWKSWQDELITALSDEDTNHKKQIDCAKEAIDNLVNLKKLLVESKSKELDYYVKQMNELKDDVTRDIYSDNMDMNRRYAERLRRNILRDFSYNKIKNYML